MNNTLPIKTIIILALSSISLGVMSSAFVASYTILNDETTNRQPMIYKFGYSEPYEDTTPNQIKIIG